jgi:two-component system, NtrC family, sensor kinase
MNLPEQRNRRVLIIDDNRAVHEGFRKILNPGEPVSSAVDQSEALLFGTPVKTAATPQFDLDSAYQGEEGLALVKQALEEGRPYAMAFLDVRMPPGWDGVETARRIWEIYPDLQIVLCTAYSDYSWDEMIAHVGLSDRLVILKKPFDNVEALQLACALTEKWRLLQQSRSRFNDLEGRVLERTAQLLKSEERFRLIAENATDIIAVVDKEGRFLYHSPSYEKVLGFSHTRHLGASMYDCIHADDLPRVLDAMQDCIATGAAQALDARVRRHDGTWRTLESHGTPVRNAHGEVETVVIVARDITERKLAEVQQQRMEIQLRQAQKLESIGQLAAGIAHEINTPMQFIGDNTRFVQESFVALNRLLSCNDRLLHAARNGGIGPELMAEVEAAAKAADVHFLSEEIPKAIEDSLGGVARVSKIVRAMKEFSHPGTEEMTPINLNQAIDCTLTVAASAWKYVAEIQTEFDTTLPAVPCLPGEVNQVILNLVVNASHAIADVVSPGAKGVITMTTRRVDPWAEIRVRDNGSGIPEKIRDRIFDPFFTTKPVGKGTGQGLAIAHSVVVDKHQGTLTFETELGVGTTFIVRLPLAGRSQETKTA